MYWKGACRLAACLLAGGSMMLAASPAAADIELAHQLGEERSEALRKLADRFNEQNPKGPKIVISDRYWRDADPPHMSIVAELDEDMFLASSKRVVPIWKLMQDAKVKLDTLTPPRMLVPSALDSRGRLVGLPVGLATPVVFFNKAELTRVGVNPDAPPATWLDWQGVLGKLYQAGSQCPFAVSQPVSALIENTSAWHNQPLVKAGKAEEFVGNGLVQVKHVAFMATWYKARYMVYHGRGSEAEKHFADGACAVMVAPSSSFLPLSKQAKFELGVAPFPYHDGTYGTPQNTLADGPALWVAAGKTPAEYRTIARFIAFMLTPESQVEWMVGSGYLPLNRAGLLVMESRLLKDDLVAQRMAVSQLTNKPVTTASAASSFTHRNGVRRILGEEMESVFADKKPSKQALDEAVMRIKRGEGGCCGVLH
ncbi:extracellular solute-binding protein [Uliginosibacterium sp. H1]|uniref:extracellular solute-binding protein n=1 Tax=Uliginosibacterium sp. H1 TaxID=3114757 RepID=UPI002E1706B9|nr:extracellular solute-binding protein [Uliginosibacterium sp. H1]